MIEVSETTQEELQRLSNAHRISVHKALAIAVHLAYATEGGRRKFAQIAGAVKATLGA